MQEATHHQVEATRAAGNSVDDYNGLGGASW